MKIDQERLIQTFLALTEGSAESLDERRVADLLTGWLREMGFAVCEDDAGERLHGNAGNLYAVWEGTIPGEPLLLSAHMDTVAPGKNKKPLLHPDGTITTDGTTVLGADDAAGLTEILEGIRAVRDAGLPHRTVELLFPVAEEIYIRGSSIFDFSRIRARQGYVLDMSGDVGSAAIQAPSLISYCVTVQGRASHAGFAPENGIHAVAAAARAVARLPQGKVDPETTCNLGTISGGTARNIIPEQCVCTGEIRSFSHEQALRQIAEIKTAFTEEAESCGASVRMETTEILHSYRIEESAPVVQRFLRVCKQQELPGILRTTLGGSDNHNFLKAGISGIVLSCGMYRVHSTEEFTRVEELVRGAALVAGLLTDAE